MMVTMGTGDLTECALFGFYPSPLPLSRLHVCRSAMSHSLSLLCEPHASETIRSGAAFLHAAAWRPYRVLYSKESVIMAFLMGSIIWKLNLWPTGGELGSLRGWDILTLNKTTYRTIEFDLVLFFCVCSFTAFPNIFNGWEWMRRIAFSVFFSQLFLNEWIVERRF